MSHPKLAACWRIRTLESLDIVGLSRGIWSTKGSSKPNTTSLAFGFRVFGLDPSTICWLPLEVSSISFHVSIHLHLRICSLGTWCLRILETVSVDNQLSISFIFASSNICLSFGLSCDILTSLRWRLAADTRKAISCGLVSSLQFSISLWLMFTSNLST